MTKSIKPVRKKPIICSRCGKRVGYVTLRWRFNLRLILWGAAIAFATEILAQIVAQLLLGSNPSILLGHFF